jgi:GT2 family glycosyltransferase
VAESESIFSELILASAPPTPAAPTPVRAPAQPIQLSNAVDAVLLSPNGGIFIAGWIDDAFDPLASIRLQGGDWRAEFDRSALIRTRRGDLPPLSRVGHLAGYGCFAYADRPISLSGAIQVEIRLASGAELSMEVVGRLLDEEAMRETLLGWLAGGDYGGATAPILAEALDRYVGAQLLPLNRSIVSGLVRSPYVERFGPPAGELKGSIVVCLYGKVEYLFLQAALYAGRPGLGDYEFVYVINSPEISERVLSEARLAALTYGLVITVVVLAGNAGFAAANNAAVACARTDRVLFVNPDVFPRADDWALRHSGLLASRPLDETRLFGSTLYYDDGSLMHAGMYVDADQGVIADGRSARSWRLLRVEHYGKGAPPDDPVLTRPRAVPMVTGAFISAERAWFERLEGFSVDYIFGHYEDADLSLRSLDAGAPPWLQALDLYHLEGKGSKPRAAHEGASLFNRWLFTSRWSDREDLFGRAPRHGASA